jgi:hypothetical protein
VWNSETLNYTRVNSLGNNYIITGQAMQVGASRSLFNSGNNSINTPAAAHAFPSMPSAVSQLDTGASNFLATLLPATVPAGYDYLVDVTRPSFIRQLSTDPANFIQVTSIATSGNSNVNLWNELITALTGQVPLTGQWISIKRRFLQLDTGQLGSEANVSVPIT